MNLLEHYIKEIHSVKDITEDYIKRIGHKPKEPLYVVDLTYDCYGIVKREKIHFLNRNLNRQKKMVIL